MKLAILGATGKVGRTLTARALEVGHEVTALVRNPAKLEISHVKLRVRRGDATNAADVASLIQGQDAVLNALAPTKSSPKDVLEISTRLVIAAMKQCGVRRTVIVGGAGMRMPQDSQDFGTRAIGWLVSKIIPDAVADKKRQLELLQNSGVEFVILRAPQITSGERSGKYTIGYTPMVPGAQITPADLSDAMLEMLVNDEFLNSAPAIRS